jgi:hypothetical protein
MSQWYKAFPSLPNSRCRLIARLDITQSGRYFLAFLTGPNFFPKEHYIG